MDDVLSRFPADITGLTFHRLTVKGRSAEKPGCWECHCACGNVRHYCRANLIRGAIKSCGCFRKENVATFSRSHGHTVGGKLSREYVAWSSMIQRCTNPNSREYHRYGAKGVTVCDRWLSFENFLADVGAKPSPDHSLDRYPDNDGNYVPGNVRWATETEQQNNRRNNRHITHAGRTATLAEWGRITGISPDTLAARIKKGWSVEKALTTRPRHSGRC